MLLLTSLVVVCAANVVLGLVVYLNDPQKSSTRYFALLCLGLSVWASFNYLADFQLSNTLLWTRLTFFAITYAVAFLVLFLLNFPRLLSRSKFLAPVILLLATGVATISMLPGFIPGVDIKDGVSNVQTGPLYFVFLAYILAFFVAMIIAIVASWRRSDRENRSRLGFLIFGIVAMAVFISLTNLVLPLITGQNNLAKYGALFTLIFVGATAYAMIRHSLFDIRAVVARSFTYALTIITIGGVYGILAFGVIGQYLFSATIKQISLPQQFINTTLAVVLAFTFQPIRRFFQKVTDQIFYRDKYDPQKLLNDISLILASEIEIDEVSSKVCKQLKDTMHLQSVGVVVLDKSQVLYETKSLARALRERELGELKKLGKTLVYANRLEKGDRLDTLTKLGVSVSAALKTSNQFIGYLLIGEKQSGDIFNTSDLETLKIVAGELSIALENAIAYSEIQQFNQTLKDKISKATISLRKANDQLKELDVAKDEFISLAGHQLRTPLTTVKGYVSMLNDGDFGELSKEQKNSIELALDGSNRMARLIDDLLNVSRMEAGKFFIDASKVDLGKIVPEELQLLKTFANSKNVQIKYRASQKPVPIMRLDDNKTRQAIMNLIENAIQYSPRTGGVVEVELQQKDESIVFTVKDNGIGVPKDQQAKLFNKMFRASNAKEIRPDGTGLGLFLVKRVIEDQGGKIIFESKPAKGSLFGFSIPINNSIKVDEQAKKQLLSQPA